MKQLITLIAAAIVYCAGTVSAQEFIFIYPEVDSASRTGFDDPTQVTSDITGLPTTLGADRRACIEAAADVWARYLTITVPVQVEARFGSLGGNNSGAVLGFAGPISVFTDFTNAPFGSTWFTSAQANQFRGADLDPGDADIQASFNSDVDLPTVLGEVSWYYGIDGNPGSDIDFFSTAMHELGHGLGFLSLVDDDGSLLGDLPDIYSRQLQDTNFSPSEFVNMTTPQRAAALTGDNLTWFGPSVVADKGEPVKMYAPNPLESGSSTSHWDTSLTPNELMEPFATDPFTDIGLEIPAFNDMFWPMEEGATPALIERPFDFRALPARTSEGAPVVSLNWIDPDLGRYSKATLVRSVSDYPEALIDGAIIFNERGSQFLDTNVIEGTRYYYTLFLQFTTGPSQVSRATVVAGENAPVVLSEPFAPTGSGLPGTPLDLSFKQITYTPVGPPVDLLDREVGYAGYESYEASIVSNIRDFPVAREDNQGGSFNLPLSDDGTFGFFLGSLRFPYFSRDYSQMYVHANGFISFTRIGPDNPLSLPGIAEHFAVPRIAGLFSDLSPTNGGEVWLRVLEDRIVVTYDNVPGATVGGIFTPPQGNSFQIELFFSGQIRMTYKNLTVPGAFVGISDGRGIPRRPEELFPGLTSTLSAVDFSALPAAPSRMHFLPVTPVIVGEGELVQFDVSTFFTSIDGSAPLLSAEWTKEGTPPFGDNGDGSGTLRWTTTAEDLGVTVLRVSARLGTERAFQDIRLIVDEVTTPPEALNLQISTGAPNEDPTESRIVSSDRPLFASYEYFHPKLLSEPTLYREGPSLVRWFRNGESIPSLWGSLTVPSNATRAGDVWHFRVVPLTSSFIAGEEAISPFVSIVDLPIIDSITPAVGLSSGGTVVRIRGSRLSPALGVTFGGSAVASSRTISDNEIEVTTPLRPAGSVDVAVRTSRGTGTLPRGFRYVSSLDDLDPEDVNADGKVDAVDIQIVAGAVLNNSKLADKAVNSPDVNGDGKVNAADLQLTVNRALLR